MKIVILGAAGFIGTNLILKLAEDKDNQIRAVDKEDAYFSHLKNKNLDNVTYRTSQLGPEINFDEVIDGFDIVYHLVSTTVPTTSNQHVSQELQSNVIFSSNLFQACVRCKIKRVVFISSGGTVYGKDAVCPISEDAPTFPISSYGLQKITIEKLLYLFNYIYGLDYRVIRLANPYGPYQRPNSLLGAVTTFTYKALKGEKISVYGNGSVIRDFIYISDAVNGILNIANGGSGHKTFNLGSGRGTSINSVLETIEKTLNFKIDPTYEKARQVDVPVNYLDIKRYEEIYGELNPISLEEGIKRTADFLVKTL